MYKYVHKNSPIRGWGGLSKMSKKMSKIELSQLGQDLFDFSDLTWAHPLTHPSTHRWGCLHKSSIFKQNRIISISSSFIKLVIWPDPTHSPIHPPTGGGVSTDFKSSNGIEISWLVQVLLNFDWFWGSPLGDGRWVDGDGCGCVLGV